MDSCIQKEPVLTPLTGSFWMQVGLRLLNGMSLSAVVPLAQAILAGLVDPAQHGQAFGFVEAGG